MDINTVDSLRNIIQNSSVIVFILALVVASLGLFRPKLFSFIFKEYAERKYVIVAGMFVSLLCGTIYTATQPTSDTYESKNTSQSQYQTPAPLPQPAETALETAPAAPVSSESSSPSPAPASQESSTSKSPPRQTSNSSSQPATQSNTSNQTANTGSNKDKCNLINIGAVCL